MDLIKIGKFIASKRKELCMTQRQLAELLGMSDKSVSKWERGVCLPDVSVYSDLCSALGISINEFFAGEDIDQEMIVQKSEENILVVAADGKHRQNRLKRVIYLMIVLIIAAGAAVGAIVLQSSRPENYIAPVEKDSIEMKTAEMLSGADGAYIYKYVTTDAYASLKVFISEYHSGELVYKGDMGLAYEDMASPENGMILIVPDFRNFVLKLIVANDSSKFSTEIPILENVSDREYFGRSATQIDGRIPVRYDEEQGLAAFIYDNDRMRVFDLGELMEGKTDVVAENDYVYCFSVAFCKDDFGG